MNQQLTSIISVDQGLTWVDWDGMSAKAPLEIPCYLSGASGQGDATVILVGWQRGDTMTSIGKRIPLTARIAFDPFQSKRSAWLSKRLARQRDKTALPATRYLLQARRR